MKIKELREEKGFTQAELARAINTSQRNIGRWENEENEPTYSQLVKLSNFFGVSIDYLVGREDDFGNITVAGASSELTPEEQTLLANYRKLNNVERRTVYDTAQLLASKSSSAKNII